MLECASLKKDATPPAQIYFSKNVANNSNCRGKTATPPKNSPSFNLSNELGELNIDAMAVSSAGLRMVVKWISSILH